MKMISKIFEHPNLKILASVANRGTKNIPFIMCKIIEGLIWLSGIRGNVGITANQNFMFIIL